MHNNELDHPVIVKRLKAMNNEETNNTNINNNQHLDNNLPVAETVEQFLLNPDDFQPRDEYISSNHFVDDDTVLTLAVKLNNVPAVIQVHIRA